MTRPQCARCARELATGQAMCICGCEQQPRAEYTSQTAFGRLTALQVGRQELGRCK